MTRTRIAPSPTGYLHIGTARTAFFNWLFAKKQGGEFILRIEDTDLERSDKKYEEDITKGLEWLGLDWHNKEIFRQSERLDIYENYLKKLLKLGKAFWCSHPKEELETEQKEQASKKEAPRHICSHKNKKLEKGQIIRLSVNTDSKEKISFHDEIRGNIEWEEGLLGDFSLAKDLRTPLYNFAVVVDDIEMKISHVIRGEDHISNTPKQLLVYEALDVKPPRLAHLPLILGSDKSKLSKRHGAIPITEYKKDYLPEALINFMGFLGYTYSKEILSKEEMVQEFDLNKVHKSGAIFDVKKLNWINSQWIKTLNPENFVSILNQVMPRPMEWRPNVYVQGATSTITTRMEKLSEIADFPYLIREKGKENPDYPKEQLKWRDFGFEELKNSLQESRIIVETKKKKEDIKLALDDLANKLGDRGLVYWPLRVALTEGREKSPDPIEVLDDFENNAETLQRIDKAIKKLE